jgi:hypothetical protein
MATTPNAKDKGTVTYVCARGGTSWFNTGRDKILAGKATLVADARQHGTTNNSGSVTFQTARQRHVKEEHGDGGLLLARQHVWKPKVKTRTN